MDEKLYSNNENEREIWFFLNCGKKTIGISNCKKKKIAVFGLTFQV